MKGKLLNMSEYTDFLIMKNIKLHGVIKNLCYQCIFHQIIIILRMIVWERSNYSWLKWNNTNKSLNSTLNNPQKRLIDNNISCRPKSLSHSENNTVKNSIEIDCSSKEMFQKPDVPTKSSPPMIKEYLTWILTLILLEWMMIHCK